MQKYIAVFEVEDDCNILTIDAEVKYTYETNGTNWKAIEDVEFVRVEEPEQKRVSLPKGHGDLKDYNTLDDTIARLNEQGWGVTRYEYKRISGVLFEMPTIIEADKGDE